MRNLNDSGGAGAYGIHLKKKNNNNNNKNTRHSIRNILEI